MPIGINDSLPSVSLIFGILVDEENKMRMLVDTRAGEYRQFTFLYVGHVTMS